MLDAYNLLLFWEIMFTVKIMKRKLKGNERQAQENMSVYTVKWRSQQVMMELIVLIIVIFQF